MLGVIIVHLMLHRVHFIPEVHLDVGLSFIYLLLAHSVKEQTAVLIYHTCNNNTIIIMIILGYQLGKLNNIPMPNKQSEMEISGADCCAAFFKCHSSLSLRDPDATTLTHSDTSALSRQQLEAKNISNMKETGIDTWQRANRVVPRRGRKKWAAI